MSRALAVLALALSLACCAAPVASTLRVMQFNVWHEGTSVPGGFEQIVDVVLAANADIVTLSEVRNRDGVDFHERLRGALAEAGSVYNGHYVAGDVGLLSRWPIERAEVAADVDGNANVVAYHLRSPDGAPLIVCVAHLDYTHYALFLPRGADGVTWEMIDPDGDGVADPVTDVAQLHALDAASTRDEAHAAFLGYVARESLSDVPVLYAGDFNETSHLDWTDATKDLFDHNGVVIEWRHTKRLHAAGFSDAWRDVHPNPVTHPGATWPSEASHGKSTAWVPWGDERDRIDLVFHNGVGLRALDARLVGSRRYWVREELITADDASMFVGEELPWPSDHKGVVIDFAFEASP